jgi:hypothetical protein
MLPLVTSDTVMSAGMRNAVHARKLNMAES